jgi:hypothetical protein
VINRSVVFLRCLLVCVMSCYPWLHAVGRKYWNLEMQMYLAKRIWENTPLHKWRRILPFYINKCVPACLGLSLFFFRQHELMEEVFGHCSCSSSYGSRHSLTD